MKQDIPTGLKKQLIKSQNAVLKRDSRYMLDASVSKWDNLTFFAKGLREKVCG